MSGSCLVFPMANTKRYELVKNFVAFAAWSRPTSCRRKKKAPIPAYVGTEHSFSDLCGFNIKCYSDMIAYGVQSPYFPRKSRCYDAQTEMMTSVLSGLSTNADACAKLHQIITEIESEWAGAMYLMMGRARYGKEANEKLYFCFTVAMCYGILGQK